MFCTHLLKFLVSYSDDGRGAPAPVDVSIRNWLERFCEAVSDLATARVDAVAPVAGVFDHEVVRAVGDGVHGLMALVHDGIHAICVGVVVGGVAVTEILVVELPVVLVEGCGRVMQTGSGRCRPVVRQATRDVHGVRIVTRRVRHDACEQGAGRVVVGQVRSVLALVAEEVAVVAADVARREDVLRQVHVLLLVLFLCEETRQAAYTCLVFLPFIE